MRPIVLNVTGSNLPIPSHATGLPAHRPVNTAFCYITAVPEHVLLAIFEFIQPRLGPVIRASFAVSPVRRREGDGLPYELHLAQGIARKLLNCVTNSRRSVCKTFRATAFQLREGHCLDIKNYIPKSRVKPPCPQCDGLFEDHRRNEDKEYSIHHEPIPLDCNHNAYEIFLQDPGRTESVRRLSFWFRPRSVPARARKEPLHCRYNLVQTFNMVDLTRLRQLSIDGTRSGEADRFMVETVARMFVDAAQKTGHPLGLRTLKLYGMERSTWSCHILQFMRLLQSSLRDLVLEISFNAYIPADIRFDSLQSLRINPSVKFRDFAASMPNLKSAKIFRGDIFCREVPTVHTFTQQTLTSFSWRGPWPGVLSTLPNITSRFLTSLSIDVQRMDGDVQIDHFSLVFPHLYELTFLSINDNLASANPFGCRHFHAILTRIPSRKLKEMRMAVHDWDHVAINDGLMRKPSLEEVVLSVWLDEDDASMVSSIWGPKVKVYDGRQQGGLRGICRYRCSREENSDSEIDDDDDE
ncbi:hypothetical protein HDV00_012434 [Rhizophlyctis rosea]|nr:hypothetical protein HDV00_012434 [Rhizophlyctis rosea]